MVAVTCLALVVASTWCAETKVGGRARRAETPRTVRVGVTVQRVLTRIAVAFGGDTDREGVGSHGLLSEQEECG